MEPPIPAPSPSTSRTGVRTLIGRGVEVSVAAFGKHPGWNDHIDDLGLVTQRLVDFKRRLYIDGIGACVDSGRWEALASDQVLPGFAHVFLYRAGSDLIIGRMWSSADGKGRTRYPMVLCVHTRGMSLEETLGLAIAPLEQARQRCESTSTAADVVRIVHELGEEMRARAAQLPARSQPGGVATSSPLPALADHPALGPARQGFHRVMYQIDRELASFLVGQSATRSRMPDITPRHLRVPSCWSDPSAVLTRWMALFSLRVESLYPIMMILPIGLSWLDVIVGEPQGPELFCVRASATALPPASDVPFTIEPDQAFRYDQLVSGAAARAASERPATSETPAQAWSRTPSTPRAAGMQRLVLALVLGALLIGALAWLAFGQSPSSRHTRATPERTCAALVTPSGATVVLMRIALELATTAMTPASLSPTPALAAMTMAAGAHEQPTADRLTRDDVAKASPTLNAFWRTQRNRLVEFYRGVGGGDTAELTLHLQRIEQSLTALADQTPSALPPTPGPGWPSALSEELGRRREGIFERLLAPWQSQNFDPADEAGRQTVEAIRAAAVRDADAITRLAADLATVETAMQHGIGLETPLPGGPSVATLIGRWEDGGLLRDRSIRAATAPVLDRVQALREVALEMDTEQLLTRVRPPATPQPEVVVAVWRRLSARPGIPWPATASDLAIEADLGQQLRALLDRFPNPQRAATLREELAAEQRRRLIRMLSAADDEPEFEAAAVATQRLGLAPEEFEPRIRFNLMLHQFKKQLAAFASHPSERTDAEVRELARSFTVQARALPSGVAFLADAAASIELVGGMVSGEAGQSAAPARPDPTALGPAASGRYIGKLEGDRLVFTPKEPRPGEAALEFVRIVPESASGLAPFYLGTTEVSVAMFATIARNSGRRGAINELLPAFDPASDPRLGPRSWEWDARRTTIVPARHWLTSGPNGARSLYEPGATPEPPSPESPMQGLSPDAARRAAELAGCRIPTSAEWQSASSAPTAASDPAHSNLRDQAWSRHQAFVEQQLRQGRNLQLATAGGFDVGTPEVAPTDDRYVWLAGVKSVIGDGGPSASATRIHHLWGNAAEYVSGESAQPGEAVTIGVIGGSAMSDPGRRSRLSEVDPNAAAEGFADVGFRLAFSEPTLTAAEAALANRMLRALTPTPYLRPR